MKYSRAMAVAALLVFFHTISPAADSRLQTQSRQMQPMQTSQPGTARSDARAAQGTLDRQQAAPAAVENLSTTSLPDLTVTAFSTAPRTIFSGEPVTLTVEVGNSGKETVRGVFVRFVDGRRTIGEERVDIGGGKRSRINIKHVFDDSGIRLISIIVDPDNRVKESDERNNSKEAQLRIIPPKVAVQAAAGPLAAPSAVKPSAAVGLTAMATVLPDLLPLVVHFGQSSVPVGTMINVRAVIRNNSSTQYDSVSVALTLDKTVLETAEIRLPPHQSVPVRFQFAAGQPGNHDVSIAVDPDDQIKELNEHNNAVSRQLLVGQRTATKVPIAGGAGAPVAKMAGSSDRDRGTGSIPLSGMSGVPVGKRDLGDVVPLASQADLTAEVGLVGGKVPINTNDKTIKVMVRNKGSLSSPAFSVGLGKEKKGKIGDLASWLATGNVHAGGIPPSTWIYVNIPIPAQVTETMNLIVAADIGQQAAESDEGNNVSPPFQLSFVNQAASPVLPDVELTCGVEAVNGVVQGDGSGVRVKINNRGTVKSGPFRAGIGVAKPDGTGVTGPWLGTVTIPVVYPGQHVLVSIPWTIHELGPKTYIAMADIDDQVFEGGGVFEQNNSSQLFGYETISTPGIPGQPVGTEAYLVTEPQQSASFRPRDDVRVLFYLAQQILQLPPAQQTEYTLLDIRLVDGTTNKTVAVLAEEVPIKPISNAFSWLLTLPTDITDGTYYLALQSQHGFGNGASKPFKIVAPKVAQMIKVAPSVQPESAQVNPAAVAAINTKPGEPIRTTIQLVNSKLHFRPYAAGQPRVLQSIEATYTITGDQDFLIVKGPGDITDHTVDLLTVYPEFYLGVAWNPPSSLNFTNIAQTNSISYQLQSLYHKGANTFTVIYNLENQYKLGENGAYGGSYDYFVPPCPVNVLHAASYGKTFSYKWDFWVHIGLKLRGTHNGKIFGAGESEIIPVVHEVEPRYEIWY